MFVRPAPGIKVRRHDTLTLLPLEGEEVPDMAWCQRRLRDKDVVEGAAPVETAPMEAEPSATSVQEKRK